MRSSAPARSGPARASKLSPSSSARPTSHSSSCSLASIEAKRISEVSCGKMPTTSVLRAISRLSSSALQRVGRDVTVRRVAVGVKATQSSQCSEHCGADGGALGLRANHEVGRATSSVDAAQQIVGGGGVDRFVRQGRVDLAFAARGALRPVERDERWRWQDGCPRYLGLGPPPARAAFSLRRAGAPARALADNVTG